MKQRQQEYLEMMHALNRLRIEVTELIQYLGYAMFEEGGEGDGKDNGLHSGGHIYNV